MTFFFFLCKIDARLARFIIFDLKLLFFYDEDERRASRVPNGNRHTCL